MARSSVTWSVALLTLVCAFGATRASAQASVTGQTGLIHMPDARIAPEGVWRFGVSESDPYVAGWSSISALARLELSGRFTRIDGVPGLTDNPAYGAYKDKAFDAKWLARRESPHLPAVGIGVQDFTGTRLFRARYVALSKRLADFDVSVGYGRRRIDGWFGGLRYTPRWNTRLAFVLEHDANRYPDDFGAAASGAASRGGGASYGIEYRFGWITAQLSLQDDTLGGQLYVSVPLTKREFVPKIDEPPPPQATAEPGEASFLSLVQGLQAQGFHNVLVGVDGDTLRLSVTHPRITLMGRAVGRAARVALRYGPTDVRTLEITYTFFDAPVLTYSFSDLDLLRRYFRNEATLGALEKSIEVRYASADDAQDLQSDAIRLDDMPAPPAEVVYGEDGHLLKVQQQDAFLSGFSVVPLNARFFFNDPSGALHYDTFATLDFRKRLVPGVYLDSAARLTLFEDVSDVTQPSNSLLPHVRTDVAEYRRAGDRLRLESLLLNRYVQLRERAYTRLSFGYYEEMFAGAGGQILYLPARGEWAADIAFDWLKQRQPGDSFGFRDYTTLTVLGAFHYRFPARGITATARVGRFLARDEGVRLELKRRFRSGVELGAWYTATNEDDVTGPGRPGDPYHDKGIFVSIPLSTMLTRDTQAHADLAVIDFTRDVGQMVESPGDLYRLFERGLTLDSGEHGALSDLVK